MSWIALNPDRRYSVAFRLTLFHALFFGLISSGGGGLLYHLMRTHILEEVDQELLADVREQLRDLDLDGLVSLRTEIIASVAARGSSDYVARLLDADGQVILSSDSSAWPNLPNQIPPDVRQQFVTLRLPHPSRQVRVLTMAARSGRRLQMGVSLHDTTLFLAEFRRNGIIILVTMLGLGGLGGLLLARRAMQGVEAVTRSAARIADGQFAERVSAQGQGREIQDLVVTFNRMAAQVQTVMQEMRQVNDNIAHDLRSPITRIRGLAEAAALEPGLCGKARELGGGIVEECDRLIHLANTLLDIAEAEAGVQRLDWRELDLARLMAQTVELFSGVAEERGIDFGVGSVAALQARGDQRRLQRALANLVDNALKYTPRGGQVRLSVSHQGKRVAIQVADSGPGIPQQDLPHLCERFYRGDRSRHLPGNGLGLALVQAVAHAHGGDLRVTSGPTGNTFILSLPIAD